MTKRMWFSYLALTLFSAAQQEAAVAKPGDLPAEITQQCPEGSDGPMSEGFSPPRHGEGSNSPQSGAACAENRRRCADRDATPRATHQVRAIEHRVRRAALVEDVEGSRAADARQMFDLAEQCRHNGDCVRARVCYEEAHLASPTSICGRLAIDRLRDLDQNRYGAAPGGTEEAETAGPSRSLRDVGPHRPQLLDEKIRETPRRHNLVPRAEDQRRQRMLEATVPLGGIEESTSAGFAS